jgi:hypothetical protein
MKKTAIRPKNIKSFVPNFSKSNGNCSLKNKYNGVYKDVERSSEDGTKSPFSSGSPTPQGKSLMRLQMRKLSFAACEQLKARS